MYAGNATHPTKGADGAIDSHKVEILCGDGSCAPRAGTQPPGPSCKFVHSIVAVLLTLLIAYATVVSYEVKSDAYVDTYYGWYIHVSLMIFVGFGWLMTFLRRYAYSAVGLNFLLSCVCILEYSLVGGAIQQGPIGAGGAWNSVKIDLSVMIDSLFCAAASMITFGAVLGKATATQMLWLTVYQVPIYSLNYLLVVKTLGAFDTGGGIFIHVFGAYFGLAASMFLSPKGSGADHPKNAPSYVSDLTSMIGTIFLFIMWPSFNGALAAEQSVANGGRFFSVVNTVLALCCACISTFAVSSMIHKGKFSMVHIQNATLAGGVAIGTSSALYVAPAGAMAIGILAGALSTLGFAYLTPLLELHIGLKDTCGIHNLHGMPGLLGGLASAVAVAVSNDRHNLIHNSYGWAIQLAATGTTLVIGLASGALGGFVIARFCGCWSGDAVTVDRMFEDAELWHDCPHDEVDKEK